MNWNLFGVRVSTGNTVSIKATVGGDLYVAQSLPPYAVLSASGAGAICQMTAAAAGTTTIPTTTAIATLWNGEAGGGKSLVIDRIFCNTEAYDAGNNFFFIWVCMHPSGMTAPTDDGAIKNLNGGNYGGSARFDSAATVANDTWNSWGNSLRSAAANADGMSNIDIPVEGRLTVAPTGGISLHIGCNDSNLTGQVGVSWFEVQLDRG